MTESVRDITGDQIVQKEFPTVNKNDNLSKIKSKMETQSVFDFLVTDGKNLIGSIRFEKMIQEFNTNPKSNKIKNFMHEPPQLNSTDLKNYNLVHLSSLIIDSGSRVIAVTENKNKVVGTIYQSDIVEKILNTDEINGEKLSNLAKEPITANPEVSHDEIRRLMMDNKTTNIIIEDEGKILGIVGKRDLLKTIVPPERMGEFDLKGEKESRSKIPASQIMDESPLITTKDLDLSQAIKKIKQEDSDFLVYKEENEFSILTPKSILSYIAELTPHKLLRVNLIGVETPEKKLSIHRKVEKSLKGALRVLNDPEELKIRYKKAEKEGKRHRYSINFKLISELGVTTVSSEGWDLLNVIDEGLEELEKVVKKEKSKKRDKRRKS